MNPSRKAGGDEREDPVSRLAGRLDRREPPADLWARVEKRLEMEAEKSPSFGESTPGARKGQVRFSRFFRLADGRWSGKRIFLAAAAVVLAAVFSVPGLRDPLFSLVNGTSRTELAGVEKEAARAEREYRQAIERLTVLAGQKEKEIKPGLLALYREKLDLLDASIRECRAALETNYRNPSAHAALLYCYQQKAETLKRMAGETKS